ncbi:glycine N-phenylacetyltransferase-like [Clarias gariepinus]|uniref:glycine N-acyltransferase-like protein n=1 Tax=Clarias gariepinus TaxID=13013 RepID=UPI00234D3E3B|nr:glycine N-acyltransferase-like protein [Clarias gariepinus]
MKVLSREELKRAEEELQHYFPQSQQAYGYVFLMNRVEVYPIDVLVDQWPDFNVLLISPQRKEKADLFKDSCLFTKDQTSLRNMLIRTDIFDWKQVFSLGYPYKCPHSMSLTLIWSIVTGSLAWGNLANASPGTLL